MARWQTYQITFTGQADTTLRAEFDDCEVTVGQGTTTLRAELYDQAALSGLIQRVIGLRLSLVRVAMEPPGSDEPPRGDPAGHAPVSATEVQLTQFVFDVVNRLFSVGLALTSAQGLVGDGAAGERLAAAIDDLDDAIREIRTTAFSLILDRG